MISILYQFQRKQYWTMDQTEATMHAVQGSDAMEWNTLAIWNELGMGSVEISFRPIAHDPTTYHGAFRKIGP